MSKLAKLSECCPIPLRYVLCILCFFGVLNAYTMRICLSMTITEMVIHGSSLNNTSPTDDPDACPETNGGNTTWAISNRNTLFIWSEKVQGLILGAFYWGYAISQIPGGLLAEKFGGKHVLGLGLFMTTLFTLITPITIIQSGGNWKYLVVLRFFEGLGSGPLFPALSVLLSKWAPVNERATMNTLAYAGCSVGTIVSNLLSGYLIKTTKDWSTVFYFFGGLGLVWFLLWTLLCYSEPAKHPFISEKEKALIEHDLKHSSDQKLPTPWMAMFKSMPVWAIIAAQIGHNWIYNTLVIDLPKYMKSVLKFHVTENGLWSSLPHLVMWITTVSCGFVCDWLIRQKYLSISFARKLFTTIGGVGPGVFVVAASYSGCNKTMAVAMFTAALGSMGPCYSGLAVNILDVTPKFAGTLMAISNGLGALTGIAAPGLIGYLAPNSTLKEWRQVFWISFTIATVSCIIYCMFASAKEQWWNNTEKEDSDGEENCTTKL